MQSAFENVTFEVAQNWNESSSSSYLHEKWNNFLDVVGDDPDFVYVWCLTIWTYGWFWAIGAVFLLVDLTGWPAFMRKYKNQPGTNEPPEWAKLKRLVTRVALNQFVYGVPFAYLTYYLRKMTLEMPDIRQLPTIDVFLRDFVVCVVTWEMGFYYSHRFLHAGFWYKYIHKVHHEWSSPVAWSVMYCHPFEFILSDQIPIFIGPAICKSHPVTIAVWFLYVVVDTVVDHSGYHIPFFLYSRQHDYHHEKFNENFGVFGWCDSLHGTNKKYLQKIRSAKKATQFSQDSDSLVQKNR